MRSSDDENLVLVDGAEKVDDINQQFYKQYPYPWPSSAFYFSSDQKLYWRFLHQNLGDYTYRRLPSALRIWVGGCGTNQAVITALRYPEAEVMGSDLSPASLGAARKMAERFGLRNLQLRQESINGVQYHEEFDLVICTGVIHHNSDPAHALARLRRALRRNGILELMVYNRYRRLVNHAIQKALHLLTSVTSAAERQEAEMRLVTRLISEFKPANLVGQLLKSYRGGNEAEVADALIQPVEHSYTVESLNQMTTQCGLEMLAPVISDHDESMQTFDWYVDLPAGEAREKFDSLPDVLRWHISNLLLLELSPMLWFYLQRTDSEFPRVSEAANNEAFLDCVFSRTSASQQMYLRQPSGDYALSPAKIAYPAGQPHSSVAPIFKAVNGIKSMRQILTESGYPIEFGSVLRARSRLVTSVFPYLTAERYAAAMQAQAS